ncbi:PucR family transcriptional regulator [Arthrobacter sp. S2(2024)]|uniref:PucR family transcriptional regulator n=1 Tax=Arthrobacter sp. S2(2024) TaxID=3111911 RepID=UPI002FC9D372
MSRARSWVRDLHPAGSADRLKPACLPATWNRTVGRIGLDAALWAVEISLELAQLGVDPATPATRREEATQELRPPAEAVVMEALLALDQGVPVPTTVPLEMVLQTARAVRQRVPLAKILEVQRVSHARFSDVLVEEFRRLVPAEMQSKELAELSHFLVDHVSTFALASSAAYAAEEQAWLASVDGSRAELVRALLRGEALGPDRAKLRYELANRTHVGLVLRREGRDDATVEGLDRAAAMLLARMGATAQLVLPAGNHEVWAWGAFLEPKAVNMAAIKGVPHTLVAVGRPATGLEGFRGSHEEAVSAANVSLLAPAGKPWSEPVFFKDARFAVLLTADPAKAASFARDELGALAGSKEAALRETVRVYLEHNCSPAGAAAELSVANNTIKYRIRRAEELLGHRVKERQGILWAALYLAETIDLSPASGKEHG